MSDGVNYRLLERFEFREPGRFGVMRRIEKGTVVGPDIFDEAKQGFVISRDILAATEDPIGPAPHVDSGLEDASSVASIDGPGAANAPAAVAGRARHKQAG